MAFSFTYKGGVHKQTLYQKQQFLLFFLVDGKEIPFYRLQEQGLIQKPFWQNDDYTISVTNVCKLFLSQQGFGEPTLFFSFYFRLYAHDEVAPLVTIKPFKPEGNMFHFKARGHFLKKREVLDLLDPEAKSRVFLQRQKMLPLDLLRKIITIDRSVLRQNVRQIRVGKQR